MLLLKKMLRDIWRLKIQFIAIIIMAMLGVFAYSGIDSFTRALDKNCSDLYKATNMADLFVYTQQLSTTDTDFIDSISEIEEYELRLSFNGAHNGTAYKFIAVYENKLTTPYLVSGVPFDENNKSVWLANSYAEKHDIKPGGEIKFSDKTFKVAGTVLSSENVFTISVTSSSLYLYTSAKYLTEMFGVQNDIFNEIHIKCQPEKADAISQKIEDALDNDFLMGITREKLDSVKKSYEKVDQFGKFAYIFPAVFFTLALLTMLTTMARLITNQRMEIGVLMSQGYTKTQITFHYLLYGVLTGLIGGLGGLFIGDAVIPPILTPTVSKLFILPTWQHSVTIGGIVSVAIMTLICTLAVMLACRGKLNLMPAAILRSDPSKIKNIRTERLKAASKLSFPTKHALRNIRINKVRSVMGVIGVLGCMMMILAGFGMRNSLQATVNAAASNTFEYKVTVLNSSITGSDLNASSYQYAQQERIEIRQDNSKTLLFATIYDEGDLAHITVGKDLLKPSEDGIIISTVLAKELNLKKGNYFEFRMPGKGWQKVKVADIKKMVTPEEVIFNIKTWQEIGNTFRKNIIFIGDKDFDKKFATSVLGVLDTTSKKSVENNFEDIVKSTDMIMYILVICAIILGVTIIYNLALLNYSEMEREYATLKVIGMYPKEIKRLSARENLFLTAIGFILGLPAGLWFLNFFMGILSSLSMMFVITATPLSYIVASLITLGCSFGISLFFGKRTDKIDMVMSLKSVE